MSYIGFMSVDLPNQSLNSFSGGLPPLATTPVAENTTSDANWPVKNKSNKLKYFLGGLLALILLGGVSFGAFYFTKNLNQASVPTAPESEPQASSNDGCDGKRWQKDPVTGRVFDSCRVIKDTNGGWKLTKKGEEEGLKINEIGVILNSGGEGNNACTATVATNLKVENITDTSAKLKWNAGTGSYVALWVSSANGDPAVDCQRLPSSAPTDDVCVVNEDLERVGGEVSASNIPISTTSWTVEGMKPNTTYRWKLLTWGGNSCEKASNIVSFETVSQEATCVSGLNTTIKTTACTANGVTNGVNFIEYNCKNQTTQDKFSIQTASCMSLADIKLRAEGYCKQKYPCTGETACVDQTWTPALNTVCSGVKFDQISNCKIAKTATGTKTDGACATSLEADISVNKTAYEDDDGNDTGEYELDYEIDSVSKDQIFVYAFEITNDGETKVEEIKVVDTLKGDNTDLLTFVDSDSRCTYTASTRKVSCSGMTLEEGDTDTYAFRVKVSSGAVNGDTIMNAGEVTYKNMPSGGEIEASSELTISTVVGCNHVCVSDSECSSGLTCDPDTNKCRKPSCSESSTCNCSVADNTSDGVAPTRRATVARAVPTELVEAGILDFPGIATFGGGLLLAVIGILLAL